jgi:hypothetical protein
MCPSGRGLVVGSYVPFRYFVGSLHLCASQVGFGGRQLCALLVGGWWKAVMCLYFRVLMEGRCVPFWKGVDGMNLCVFQVGGWW